MRLRCGGIHGGSFLRLLYLHVVLYALLLARLADVSSIPGTVQFIVRFSGSMNFHGLVILSHSE